MEKDTMITLEDNSTYVLLDETEINAKKYFFAVKVDNETGKPLAGATLVVRKADGTEVVRFTSTTEPYVLTNLEDGTYTVEEVAAPAGYILSSEKKTFTIDDNHLSHQITFGNNPEVKVPDTASSSLIFTLLGIVIISTGIGFVYKNGKKAQ